MPIAGKKEKGFNMALKNVFNIKYLLKKYDTSGVLRKAASRYAGFVL